MDYKEWREYMLKNMDKTKQTIDAIKQIENKEIHIDMDYKKEIKEMLEDD